MHKKFALIGIAGYIAPRHLNAITDIGGELVAAYDIADSVGILDAYFPQCEFFTDEFAFYDFLIDSTPVDYLVVCSPNYLHEQHCYAGLKLNADIICEKPTCLTLENWQNLADAQQYSTKKIYTILQLRHHPEIIALKNSIQSDLSYDVEIKYHTPRGKWYHKSWKGNMEKSGGIATNIGIHLFDMVCWLFGEVLALQVEENTETTSKGSLQFNNARVKWDLHIGIEEKAVRSIAVNAEQIEFTDGFADLHTASYHQIMDGNGYGLDDVKASIALVEKIRTTAL